MRTCRPGSGSWTSCTATPRPRSRFSLGTQARPVYGRMFQTPFADQIRNEVGIATMAVGNIFEIDRVNGIIASDRADVCLLARPHLGDPYWILHAATQQGYKDVPWPPQYLSGKEQLKRITERAAPQQMAINV